MTARSTTDSVTAATLSLGNELRSAISKLNTRFRSMRAGDEIGDAAMSVLDQLLKQGPLTLTQLAGSARVTLGSMSQTVNRLAAGGLVERFKDDTDGRKVLLSATPQGLAIAAKARGRRHRWLHDRLDELGPQDRAVLAAAATILQRIADTPA